MTAAGSPPAAAAVGVQAPNARVGRDLKTIYEAYDAKTAAALDKVKEENRRLEQEIVERTAYIERTSFPYAEQFTPRKLVRIVGAARAKRLSKIHPIFSHEMFAANLIDLENPAWEFDPTITSFDFSDWFELAKFKEIAGLLEVTEEWREAFGKDIVCWKAKAVSHVTVQGHFYLRMMYPFVWIARIPVERVKASDYRVSYLVMLFLSWANRLANNPQTSLSIDRMIVLEDNQAYLVFKYSFRDIEVMEADNQIYTRYHLCRQVIIAACGEYIYFVSAGEPRYNPIAETEYQGHIHRWLSKFQLGVDQ